MEVEALSVDMTQANLQEQSAEIDTVKQQAEALDKLNSTVHETDPNLGQNVDLTA
jgi:hypothetical protein